ncbi:hypothetical protein SASPL_121640 [Salvia splendens]|uniref:Uncharacterized protein n=1 Tax=Salvia splendens TaxID=180675 RepID=A0A8X8XWV6_SALSN|nr:hypothetical protein SASPL_121640 [Salvia splendens]
MSDETAINIAQLVETAGDDDSPKLSVHQKISDLQSEKARITQQHEDYRKKIDELDKAVQKADELKRLSEDLNTRLGDLERDVADIDREIHLLLAHTRKLEEDEISLRCESDEEEEEIQSLKRDLEVVLESNKVLEKSRRGVEETAEQLKDKMSALEIGLADKEKVITEPEAKEMEVA